jgi:hypothetical protein
MHLEDLMGYISTAYPNIWALTGLHFNDDGNYQLASYFNSQYTNYYQHGSNSFCGRLSSYRLRIFSPDRFRIQ